MKKATKKYISLLLAAVLALSCFAGATVASAESDVEINAANFPNAAFRSFISTLYDTDQNGFLSAEERAVEDMFIFSAEPVEDITGIEHFASLKSLNAGYVGLKTADLSALGALESLTINGNSLTSLDLSANTSLRVVRCNGNNSLSQLVLPPSVVELWCDDCALTSLDVSACAGLQRLFCAHNQIASLDLSHNAALTEIRCADNRLASLDLSASTALQETNPDMICPQRVSSALSFSGKTVLAPVAVANAAMVSAPQGSGVSYNASLAAFEMQSLPQGSFEYSYNVSNSAATGAMEVLVETTRDFFVVSFYASQGGELIDYAYTAAGGSVDAPAIPQGDGCPSWSAAAQNITADTDIYVVRAEQHSHKAVSISEDDVITVRCTVCGDEYTVAFRDCYNSRSGEAGYDAAVDANGDGYINSHDFALLHGYTG